MKRILKIKYLAQYILIIAGVIIAVFPQIIKWIFYSVGAFAILYSIIRFSYSKKKNKGTFPLYKLIAGLIIGIGSIIVPSFLELGIPIFAGAFIMINGFEKFMNAFEKRKEGNDWIVPLVMGIIYSLFSFYIIANPDDVTETVSRIIGVILIIIGISKLVGKLTESQKRKNDTSGVLEVKNYKVDD